MKTIILPHDHTHNDVQYKAGETIELSDEQYAWLIKATYEMRIGHTKSMERVEGSPEWARSVLSEVDAQKGAQ